MVSSHTLMRVGVSLCLWCAAHLVAATGLQITLERNEVELGKPIWVTLSSDQTAVSLNTIDFSPWQRDFVLPRQFDMTVADDNRSQQLRLRLFPLREGRLMLPAVTFLNQKSTALTLDVSEARDPKGHSPIDFQYHVSTRTPWQQQQVIVACSLTLRDDYAVFTQPSDSVAGIQLLPMQVQQHVVHDRREPQTRYQLGWVLIPAQAGKLHVQLPPIQYVRDGVVAYQFYVPPLDLQVQALPTWLPGTIPVGKVSVTDYRLPHALLSTSVLSHVSLHLQLEGITQDSIPAYAQQLRSDRRLQYYAAQQQLQTRIDGNGIQQQLRYDIPVVARHLGIYQLPELRLQYFDPASGTLKTAHVHGASVLILNPWVKGMVLLLMLVFAIGLLRYVLRWLARQWRRYQTYQQALQQLPQSDSLPAIRQVMQTMAQAEGWPTNLTYRQWQRRMQGVAPIARDLAVTRLNAASYAQQDLTISPVVQVLTQICRVRRFALR
jgi:hypothetical protein